MWLSTIFGWDVLDRSTHWSAHWNTSSLCVHLNIVQRALSGLSANSVRSHVKKFDLNSIKTVLLQNTNKVIRMMIACHTSNSGVLIQGSDTGLCIKRFSSETSKIRIHMCELRVHNVQCHWTEVFKLLNFQFEVCFLRLTLHCKVYKNSQRLNWSSNNEK